MKSLKDILYKVEISSVIGTTDLHISAIAFDSRKVTKQSVFVAVKGIEVDGHKFISKSIGSGAIVIVAERRPSKIQGTTGKNSLWCYRV